MRKGPEGEREREREIAQFYRNARDTLFVSLFA